MKTALLLMLMVVLSACATTTRISWYDGSVITVRSKQDALVEVKKDGVEVKVDNRGRPGFIEQVFGAMLLRTPVEVKTK